MRNLGQAVDEIQADTPLAAIADTGGALKLGFHAGAPGSAGTLTLTGELDIATASRAYRFAHNVISRYRGPIVLDLASLSFCDATGLDALLRMSRHACRTGCPLHLASPSRQMLKLIRILGVSGKLPTLPAGALSPIVSVMTC